MKIKRCLINLDNLIPPMLAALQPANKIQGSASTRQSPLPKLNLQQKGKHFFGNCRCLKGTSLKGKTIVSVLNIV